jgi:hypothetical protein
VTPLVALLLIAVTCAAEVLVRAWHVVPRKRSVFA